MPLFGPEFCRNAELTAELADEALCDDAKVHQEHLNEL